ncbi:MAG: ABC transporter permease [Bifidobacteriaceae bacterium]|jgi:putative ABC transport system permease protein|nr:ABC transporter permease [Bifidobacteriaceae bacterium]
MVRGALTRQRGKRVMIALTIALGAAVATAMLGVMFDVGDKVNQELKTYGANIVVQPMGAAVIEDLYQVEAGGLATGAGLVEDEIPKIKSIFWAFNIVDFAPFVSVTAEVAELDAAEVQLTGTWFSHQIMAPTGEHVNAGVINLRSWWDVEGGWIADQDEDLAMVGAELAESRGIAIGDWLTLATANGQHKAQVAGVFASGGEEDQTIVLPLAVVQRLAAKPGLVDKLEVSALTTPDNDLARKAARNPASLSTREMETWYCTAYVSSIAYQIEEVLTDSVAKPVRQVAESEGAILQKTQLLMLLVTVLALVASALGIANLVTASVMERAPEIGLLKAVGARNGAVVGLILTEMAVVGVAGAAVGYALGLGFAQVVGHMVFGSAIAARPLVAALVAVLVALVVLAGSLPSIRALLALKPANVLHGR